MSKQTAADIAELKEKAIKDAEYLYHYKLIAKSVGRDEDTLMLWRKQDQDFSDSLEIARTAFIRKQMSKAKPDFLLERLERELFGNKVVIEGGDPIKVILEKYGIMEGDDAREADESASDSSKDTA